MRKNLFLLLLLLLCAGASNVAAQEAASALKPAAKTISGGIVNGKATNLVKPAYPAAAKAVNAGGAVNVQVTIDEEGNVISASAVSGHPLLRAAATEAARASKFSPTRLSGQAVKVTGVIVYNFVAETPAEVKMPYWGLGLIISFIKTADPALIAELDKVDRAAGDEDFEGVMKDLGIDVPQEFEAQKSLFAKLGAATGDERRQIAAEIDLSLKNQLKDQQLWQYEIGENLASVMIEMLKLPLQEKDRQFRPNESAMRTGLQNVKNAIARTPAGASPEFVQKIAKIASFADSEDLTDPKTFQELFKSIEPMFEFFN